MSIQILKAPNGDEMVVLPRAEYDQLVDLADDARDIALADEAMRRFANGEDEAVPAEFVHAMIAGENMVRLWRKHRGLTLEQLAEAAGLSKSYLSEIETGKRTGTVETMKALAAALKVDLDDLV